MDRSKTLPARLLAVALCVVLPAGAMARLPAPTPEQQQAAAAKKAEAAARAEVEKQQLADAMDRVAARWRARAASEGWAAHPPTPVAAAAGITASEKQSGPAGQPGGRLGPAAQQAPVRSEKAGTAPPSADVKRPGPAASGAPR